MQREQSVLVPDAADHAVHVADVLAGSLADWGLDGHAEQVVDEMLSDEVSCPSDASECGSADDIHALLDGEEALGDDLATLDDYAEEALVNEGDTCTPEDEGRRRSAWYDSRFELVHDGREPATTLTILQAAFHHVEALYRGATIAQVEMDIKRALAMYGPQCGDPAPDNPMCRYPRSVYICKVVCDVGDLSEAEEHLCPCYGCKHMTVFPKMSRPDLLKHVQGCTDSSCRICRCPCGGKRMSEPGPGCKPQPLAHCYFFKDVFQQFYWDPIWYKQAMAAQEAQLGNFYVNPEGLRILQKFQDAGISSNEVCLKLSGILS